MHTNTAPTSERRHSELQQAFAAFGSVSEQLSEAFDSLRGEVAQLRRALGEANANGAQLAARLSGLLKALPGGVLVLDAQGRIQESNPAALELLGAPLVGAGFEEILQRAALEANPHVDHIELRSRRFVSISRRALEEGGEVVLVADVTESHSMQMLLARQQRLLTLGELAAGLAHQIRTPLATALLYASRMTLQVRAPADLARSADKTVESLKQLDKLVTDMLAFAHGGAARERVSVSALLEQVAQWLRPALREGVRLTIRTEAPALIVRANAPSLVSAVLNLATNALQASSGSLELELLGRRSPSGRAEILVSDDGPGVPEALRARIFEPFFTTRARGHGIGLAIVKSVVESHGGHVRLEPSPRGAVFVIDLPAEESP